MAIIADIYGRRGVLLAMWTLFAVGAIVSMTANSVSVSATARSQLD